MRSQLPGRGRGRGRGRWQNLPELDVTSQGHDLSTVRDVAQGSKSTASEHASGSDFSSTTSSLHSGPVTPSHSRQSFHRPRATQPGSTQYTSPAPHQQSQFSPHYRPGPPYSPSAMAQVGQPVNRRSLAFFDQAQQGLYRGSPSSRPNQARGSRGYHGNSDGGYRGRTYYDPNSRPPPVNNRLYNPNLAHRAIFGDQQSHPQQKIVVQNTFLAHVAARELLNQISLKELQDNETFRKKLERIAQAVVAEFAKSHVTVKPGDVKLKCYGSLASGFAVPGSDMDLLVVFPTGQEPADEVKEAFPRLMENELLAQGIGAHLVERTRVPIMRVCQTPTEELLAGLAKARLEREVDSEEFRLTKDEAIAQLNVLPTTPTPKQLSLATDALATLQIDPADISLPDSPTRDATDYPKDGVGIQCDINFSNYVALDNTALLRCYCKSDERVRDMGLVIKAWAKSRKINSPRYGTLSSYGYIMMVLHFLMNVANPPVIPNLHLMYRPPPPHLASKEVTVVDGFDVRFFRDEAQIVQAAAARQITQNRESLGSLLRGFFEHYTNYRGFNWTQEVISIRTNGGILRKVNKGWTMAKHDIDSHQHHYVLAIEDPFETEHNIARTVRHRGIVAIRDEFRRAHMIINRIQYIEGVGWEWRDDGGEVGEEMLAEAEDRGDLVRFLPGERWPKKHKPAGDTGAKSDASGPDTSTSAAVQKLKESLGIGMDNKAEEFKDEKLSDPVPTDSAGRGGRRGMQEGNHECPSVDLSTRGKGRNHHGKDERIHHGRAQSEKQDTKAEQPVNQDKTAAEPSQRKMPHQPATPKVEVSNAKFQSWKESMQAKKENLPLSNDPAKKLKASMPAKDGQKGHQNDLGRRTTQVSDCNSLGARRGRRSRNGQNRGAKKDGADMRRDTRPSEQGSGRDSAKVQDKSYVDDNIKPVKDCSQSTESCPPGANPFHDRVRRNKGLSEKRPRKSSCSAKAKVRNRDHDANLSSDESESDDYCDGETYKGCKLTPLVITGETIQDENGGYTIAQFKEPASTQSSSLSTPGLSYSVSSSPKSPLSLSEQLASVSAFASCLDQRQLLDLARISSGGNGCARSGREMKVIVRRDENGKVVGYGDLAEKTKGPKGSMEIRGWLGSNDDMPTSTEDGVEEGGVVLGREELMGELPFGSGSEEG